MAQQNNDPFGIGAQWRIQQAKAGGLAPQQGSGFLNRLFNGMIMASQFVNAVNQSPAGTPGIFAGLGAVGQMRNLQAYNRYQAQQEQQARRNNLAQLEQVDSQMAKAFIGPDPSNPNGLSDDELKQALAIAGSKQAALNAQLIAGGKAPIFGMAVSPEQNNAVLKDLMARQGAVSDFEAQQQLTPKVYQQGQGTADPYFQFGQEQPMQQTGTGGYGVMMPVPQNQALQGGVSQQQQGEYQSPFFTGIIPATQYGQAFQAGADVPNNAMQRRQEQQRISIQRQQEARLERQFQEDKRQFGLKYAIDKFNADTARINANKPSGGSNNPYTVPSAQQNYLQDQLNSIDTELMRLGVLDKTTQQLKTPKAPSGSWFGAVAPSPQELSDFQYKQQLMNKRNQLVQSLTGAQAQPMAVGTSPVSIPQGGELAPGILSPKAFKTQKGRK